jgi:hypothetical protein
MIRFPAPARSAIPIVPVAEPVDEPTHIKSDFLTRFDFIMMLKK